MSGQVATALKAHRKRVAHGRDDLVFPGHRGEYLDSTALRKRFKKAIEKAKLRPLRFHDLRHTFGSLMINQASIVQVQEWMGHADIQTTRKYLHHRHRPDDAKLATKAFAPSRKRRAAKKPVSAPKAVAA
jgi:integrase